jgi:hypothetical protein
LIPFEKRYCYFIGDSIVIVRQLYNKYLPSLDETYLTKNNLEKKFSSNYHFNEYKWKWEVNFSYIIFVICSFLVIMVFFIKIKILLMLIMHFATVSVNFLYCILVIDVALLFCILETFITNTIMKQYRDKIKILTRANSTVVQCHFNKIFTNKDRISSVWIWNVFLPKSILILCFELFVEKTIICIR